MPVSVSRESCFSELPSALDPGSMTASAATSSLASMAAATTGWGSSPRSTARVISRAASKTISEA